MAYKIFIDGKEGTTGLKIFERFENRTDIEVLQISEEKRKDVAERKKLINASDITFLCLPDPAAIESVSLAENPNVRIIDASTAHRVNPAWAYGFPELSSVHREKIKNSKRVAVPGCYASGFIAIAYPLIQMGILPTDYPVTCHAVSGYSGAGKPMIAKYNDSNRDISYSSPRQYALALTHKHIPEMKIISGLEYAPIFNPLICDYFSGMVVTIPLYTRLLKQKLTPTQLCEKLSEYYNGQKLVKVMPVMGEGVLTDGMIAANALEGKNHMELFVYGNDEQITVSARLDNLGKGASGAAVQCMNIMLGLDETTGLI